MRQPSTATSKLPQDQDSHVDEDGKGAPTMVVGLLKISRVIVASPSLLTGVSVTGYCKRGHHHA